MCNTLEKKLCTKCGEYREFNQFPFRKDHNTYRKICKSCWSNNQKLYKINNETKISKQKENYYKKNIEIIKNNHKNYYLKKSEKNKHTHKLYYSKNKNKFKEKQINYRKLNNIKIRTKQKERYTTDKIYKMSVLSRSRLYLFLKTNKTLHTNEYIGCNQEELWNHLEKQFRDGMTRENHGKVWHVDHIIPLQWFKDNDLIDETNQKIACHLGNLQPLLVQENLTKGDNLPEKTNFKYFD